MKKFLILSILIAAPRSGYPRRLCLRNEYGACDRYSKIRIAMENVQISYGAGTACGDRTNEAQPRPNRGFHFFTCARKAIKAPPIRFCPASFR